MSSFLCDKCNAEIIEQHGRYVTECEHYPMEKDMSEELKPCPFCGGKRIGSQTYMIEGSVWCMNLKCRATITVKHQATQYGGEKQAKRRWNKRNLTGAAGGGVIE